MRPLLTCGEMSYLDKTRNTCTTTECGFFEYYDGIQTCVFYDDLNACPMEASYKRNTTYRTYNTEEGICVPNRKY